VGPTLPPDARLAPQLTEGGEAAGRLIGIGQLVRLLGQEFTDLSISKVRYLEDRDLLRPRRTPGGYRKYSPADIRRLRAILTLQRDEFLPLEVIRERLDRGATGTHLGRVLAAAAPLEAPHALRRDEQRVSWKEAMEVADVSDGFLRQLAEFHLVERPDSTLEPTLTDTDVEIARICGLLAGFGAEPRNLRLVRSSVEREVAMLEQIVAPVMRSQNTERREQAEKTLLDLGSLLSHLRDLLLYKDLRGFLQKG
jgi:DNA-binding transcriptional MerR regulator